MRRLAWISGAVLAAALAYSTASYAGEINPLTLQKTVGIDPAKCAAASHIVVTQGTTVFYCYTITNNGTMTFTTHALTDSVLGPITLPNGGNFDLPPGSSKFVTASLQINANTVNVATWTAMTTPETTTDVTGLIAAPQEVVAVATDLAEVDIGATAAPALGAGALAFATAALLVLGARQLNRKRDNQA